MGEQASEERFRQLFAQLDVEGAWRKSLPHKALNYVRSAARNKDNWHAFLAGNQLSQIKHLQPDTDMSDKDPVADDTEKTEYHADSEPAQKENTRGDLENAQSSDMLVDTQHQPLHFDKTGPEQQPKSDTNLQPETPGMNAANSPSHFRASPTNRFLTDTNRSDVAALSAFVRRHLAIASVEDQFFHNVPGALPEGDKRFEIDEGMLSGDDGGYTNYEDLLRDDSAAVRKRACVYTLLGSNEEEQLEVTEDGGPSASLKDKKNMAMKRPRHSSPGLSEHMEEFIRGLRELCEPHRDAAQEESDKKKDVPKNVHRKAVSAASVVEELKELEHKVRIGKIERVEECISTVSACIGNQDETFKEVVSKIEERAQVLREKRRVQKERINVINRVMDLTTGILGTGIEPAQLNSFKNDSDEDMNEATPQPSSNGNFGNLMPRRIQIPFCEEDLKCWPSGKATASDVHPVQPRIPTFYGGDNEDAAELDDEEEDLHHPNDNIVAVLGVDNPVMKNVIGWRRVFRLRQQGLSELMALRQRAAAARVASVAKVNRLPKTAADGTYVKPEDMLPPQAKQREAAPPPGRSKATVDEAQSSQTDMVEYEIRNDIYDKKAGCNPGYKHKESRERALGRAVVALLCAHEGYSHASSLAIEVLTDVLERFIQRIGLSLSSCRTNFDSPLSSAEQTLHRGPSKDEKFEQLRRICESGFRGDFPQLQLYVKTEIPRVEQSLREAELKLRASLSRIETEVAKTDAAEQGLKVDVAMDDKQSINGEQQARGRKHGKDSSSPESEVSLDDTAFTFGYLNNCISLDVLGSIKVPRKLAASTGKSKSCSPDRR